MEHKYIVVQSMYKNGDITRIVLESPSWKNTTELPQF